MSTTYVFLRCFIKRTTMKNRLQHLNYSCDIKTTFAANCKFKNEFRYISAHRITLFGQETSTDDKMRHFLPQITCTI